MNDSKVVGRSVPRPPENKPAAERVFAATLLAFAQSDKWFIILAVAFYMQCLEPSTELFSRREFDIL